MREFIQRIKGAENSYNWHLWYIRLGRQAKTDMKIWGDIPNVSGIYSKQRAVKSVEKASKKESVKDNVSISDKAKDFQSVMKALKEVPDIRENKVNELSEKYHNNNYNVEGKDIAEKIVDSVLDIKG